MPSLRNYDDLKSDIEKHIENSTQGFLKQLAESKSEDDAEQIGVIKYFHPRYLEGFLKDPRLVVSNTPGFTWGDGIYVTPLQFPKSGMMYGRVGVLGWYNIRSKKVYDATSYQGLSLYQEWIIHNIFLYQMLTTTVHSEIVNRVLRNRFKTDFEIDIIAFRPDEKSFGFENGKKWHFTDIQNDIWLSITDKKATSRQNLYFSNEVDSCRWVAVVANEFVKEGIHHKATFPISVHNQYWNSKGQLLESDSVFDNKELSSIYRGLYAKGINGAKSTIMGILP